MRFRCPHCRSVNVLEQEDAGTTIGCGACEKDMEIPESLLAPGIVFGDFAIKEIQVSRSHEKDFVAEQMPLGRDVILKVIEPELSQKEEFAKAFITAARKASKVHHPMLAEIHAIGKEVGILYLARDIGSGLTLKQKLVNSGVLQWRKAAQVVCDIAEALDHAWEEAELTHLNLKPDFINVTKRGRAQLADVGMAALDPDPDSEKITGTPQYISPERIVGLDGDIRSDLYSLGITFYFMITGDFPFNAASTSDIISKHLKEFPKPPNKIISDIPPEVCSIVGMLLEKNPNLRYQNGAMLVQDLQAVLHSEAPKHVIKAGNLSPSATGTSLKSVGKGRGNELKPGTLKVRLEGDDRATPVQRSGATEEAREARPVQAAPKAKPAPEDEPDESTTVVEVPPSNEEEPKMAKAVHKPDLSAVPRAVEGPTPLKPKDEMDTLFDALDEVIGELEEGAVHIDEDPVANSGSGTAQGRMVVRVVDDDPEERTYPSPEFDDDDDDEPVEEAPQAKKSSRSRTAVGLANKKKKKLKTRAGLSSKNNLKRKG